MASLNPKWESNIILWNSGDYSLGFLVLILIIPTILHNLWRLQNLFPRIKAAAHSSSLHTRWIILFLTDHTDTEMPVSFSLRWHCRIFLSFLPIRPFFPIIYKNIKWNGSSISPWKNQPLTIFLHQKSMNYCNTFLPLSWSDSPNTIVQLNAYHSPGTVSRSVFTKIPVFSLR